MSLAVLAFPQQAMACILRRIKGESKLAQAGNLAGIWGSIPSWFNSHSGKILRETVQLCVLVPPGVTNLLCIKFAAFNILHLSSTGSIRSRWWEGGWYPLVRPLPSASSRGAPIVGGVAQAYSSPIVLAGVRTCPTRRPRLSLANLKITTAGFASRSWMPGSTAICPFRRR